MLIVGSAAALTAIAAYFVWFLAKRGRELWRQRKAEKPLPGDREAWHSRRKMAAPSWSNAGSTVSESRQQGELSHE
jgi:hypothetical protein